MGMTQGVMQVMDMEQVPDIAKARVVVLSDGRAGGENRSIGLAEMLGVKDPEVITLKPKYTGKGLGRLLRLLPPAKLYPDFDRFVADMADTEVLIGAGYQISRVLRLLKGKYPAVFTVCLMRPSGKPADYDVVAVEQHDRYKPAMAENAKVANVVVTLGATNRITQARLALEADRWRKRLGDVKGYKLALMVGGTSKHAPFDEEDVRDLVETVAKVLNGKGGVLATTSRRSGPEVGEALEAALEDSGLPYFFWSPENQVHRDNPYLAYLALADGVLVTADSVSMVSEAATAGKPIYLWGEEKAVPAKFRAFYDALCKQARARWWNGQLNLRAPAAGLMDTLMVAGFVRAKWNKRILGKR